MEYRGYKLGDRITLKIPNLYTVPSDIKLDSIDIIIEGFWIDIGRDDRIRIVFQVGKGIERLEIREEGVSTYLYNSSCWRSFEFINKYKV